MNKKINAVHKYHPMTYKFAYIMCDKRQHMADKAAIVVKPITNKWVFRRYLKKLWEPQASVECNHDNPVSGNQHTL